MELISEKGKLSYTKNQKNEEPPRALPPKQTVNVIFSGAKINGVMFITAKNFAKDPVIHGKRSKETLDGKSITFEDEDAEELTMPRNDVLVIILRVLDTDINRVFIDPGSSLNIIQLRVTEEM